MSDENNPKNNPLSQFGDKLNQWKPGQSGNPAGRPKGSKDSIAAYCRRIGVKNLSWDNIKEKFKSNGIDLEDGTNNEAIAMVLVMKALDGDLKAIEMCQKCQDGQQVDLNELSQPPQINITLIKAIGSTAPARKSITINGREYPIQRVKKNGNGGNGHHENV